MGFVLMLSLASASISLSSDLDGVYNLGDTIDLNLQVTAEQEINDVFVVNFVCDYSEVEVYKEYLFLSQGDQMEKNVRVPLVKNFVGESKGDCKFEASLGDSKIDVGSVFSVSDIIDIQITFGSDEFIPGENILINGKATKENGKSVEGEVVVKLIIEGGDDLEVLGDCVDGEFNIEIAFPSNTKAGRHALNIDLVEKDSNGIALSKGSLKENINVKQVAKNLEVILDKREVMPGEILIIKTILHDQTGENIEADSYVAIKDSFNVIVERIEGNNGEDIEYVVPLNQSPKEWKVSVYSEEVVSEASFIILEKKDVKIEILENTLIITNVGNVIYDEVVDVEIGDEVLNVETKLGVGESVEYALSAPNGEYEIQVGNFSEEVFLTGKAIKAKKISAGEFSFFSNILVWIFVLLVLGVVSFGIYKKGFNKSFFKKSFGKKPLKEKVITVGDLIDSKEKLALSLSIVGNKQDATVVCLKVRNYDEVKFGTGGVKESFKKIGNIVEKEKGLIYENKGNFYFVMAHIKTKTFDNELHAIKLAETLRKLLENHNKLFKVKINFGLSVNYGTVVTKLAPENNQFMAMGELLMGSRKIATHSDKEILLSETLKDKVKTDFKTEKSDVGGVKFFHIREQIKKGNHNTFIQGFLDRQQRDRLSKK